MAAFKASKLVCSAIEPITTKIRLMSSERADTWVMAGACGVHVVGQLQREATAVEMFRCERDTSL